MMKKIGLFIIGLTISLGCQALDLYGLSEQEAQGVLKKHRKEITELNTLVEREVRYMHSHTQALDKAADARGQRISEKKRALVDKLKKEYGFLWVDMAVVWYPQDNSTSMSIEVIDKNHPERLRFITKNQEDSNHADKRQHALDVIEAMIKYEQLSMDLLMQQKIKSSSSCPVYHCLVGFSHSQLKGYLAQFDRGAIKEKPLILKTLRNDKDSERRQAAAFLVGHFKDPQAIVNTLLPYVMDSDAGVRNNAMRVIGMTLSKAKLTDIDVSPFIRLLDSPYDTDRNKALVVLLNAAESDKAKHKILHQAGDNLLALIRLRQPNNHDWAYLVLKKISGQDFGATNVPGWERWVTQATA